MPWHEFLSHLINREQVFADPIWLMSDGTSLRRPIPSLNEDSDDQHLGGSPTGYRLYEIVSLEFEPVANTTGSPCLLSVEQQFDEIEQAARLSGLIYRRKDDRIIVRSPYTC